MNSTFKQHKQSQVLGNNFKNCYKNKAEDEENDINKYVW